MILLPLTWSRTECNVHLNLQTPYQPRLSLDNFYKNKEYFPQHVLFIFLTKVYHTILPVRIVIKPIIFSIHLLEHFYFYVATLYVPFNVIGDHLQMKIALKFYAAIFPL